MCLSESKCVAVCCLLYSVCLSESKCVAVCCLLYSVCLSESKCVAVCCLLYSVCVSESKCVAVCVRPCVEATLLFASFHVQFYASSVTPRFTDTAERWNVPRTVVVKIHPHNNDNNSSRRLCTKTNCLHPHSW